MAIMARGCQLKLRAGRRCSNVLPLPLQRCMHTQAGMCMHACMSVLQRRAGSVLLDSSPACRPAWPWPAALPLLYLAWLASPAWAIVEELYRGVVVTCAIAGLISERCMGALCIAYVTATSLRLHAAHGGAASAAAQLPRWLRFAWRFCQYAVVW